MLRTRLLVSMGVLSVALALPLTGAQSAGATAPPVGRQAPWGHGQTIDGLAGFLTTPSCTRDGFCAAIDAYGNVVERHGSWDVTPKHVVAPGHNDLSCVSSQFCLVIGGKGTSSLFDGVAWHPLDLPAGVQLFAVSCAGTVRCLGVSAHDVWYFNGSTWVGHQLIDADSRLSQLSCSTNETCIASDVAGRLVLLADGVWQSPADFGQRHIGSVSCASPTYCLTIDTAGTTVRYTPKRGFSTVASPPLTAASALSCSRVASCVAVDGAQASTFDGRSWTQPTTLDYGVSAVSCGRPTMCVAVGDFKAAEYDGASWRIVTVERGQGVHLAVSCPSSTFCAVGDYYGNALTYREGAWSTPRGVDQADFGFLAVSCSSETFCVAGDSIGDVVTYDGAHWSAPAATGLQVVYSVSCPTAMFCVASGLGEVGTFDGTTWSTVATDPGYNIEAVSCPSVTFCVTLEANGQDTHTTTWDGQTWSTPTVVPGWPLDPFSLSCSSASFCMAGSAIGWFSTFDGSAWSTPAQMPGNPTVSALSCRSKTFCVTVGDQSRSRWDGQAWADPEKIDLVRPPKRGTAQDVGLTGVSCASSTFCVAVDAYGRALVTNAP